MDAPSQKIVRQSTLTVDQAVEILDRLKDKHPVSYIVGTYLAIHTDMRRGEIAGLTWKDTDFQPSSLSIVRSRQRFGGEDIVGDPKTEKSVHTVAISAEVIGTLKDWRRRQQEYHLRVGHAWADDAYILRHLDGDLYDPNTLTKDLRKAEIALDLPHVSFHDLRHTHATILLEAGTPLMTVSDRLGHGTIRLTADVYAHVTDKMAREAVDNFSSAYKKSTGK